MHLGLSGPAAGWQVLGVQAAAPDRPQACRVALLNAARDRLLHLNWTPGAGFEPNYLDLQSTLPDESAGAAFVDHRLIVGTDVWVCGVNCNTGAVSQILRSNNPCTLDPFGTELVVATDYGLLTNRFWGGPETPLTADDIEPLHVARLDASDMVVVAGEDDSHFRLVIACWGCLTVAAIKKSAFNEHGEFVRSKEIAVRLPYDPVYMPKTYLPGPLVYATDEGGCGLVALDIRNEAVIDFPSEPATGYGFIRQVLPCLDSNACLVRTRSGAWVRWVPGKGPDPIELAKGRILLWQQDRALVLDENEAVLCDNPLAYS